MPGLPMHEPVVNDFGGAPIADHDYACPVCRVTKAVLNLDSGRFKPCWECQEAGWRLIRRRWRRR